MMHSAVRAGGCDTPCAQARKSALRGSCVWEADSSQRNCWAALRRDAIDVHG